MRACQHLTARLKERKIQCLGGIQKARHSSTCRGNIQDIKMGLLQLILSLTTRLTFLSIQREIRSRKTLQMDEILCSAPLPQTPFGGVDASCCSWPQPQLFKSAFRDGNTDIIQEKHQKYVQGPRCERDSSCRASLLISAGQSCGPNDAPATVVFIEP